MKINYEIKKIPYLNSIILSFASNLNQMINFLPATILR